MNTKSAKTNSYYIYMKLFSNIYNAFYLSNIAMISDMILIPPQ